MAESGEFLAWVETVLHQAEVAMLNGDAAPRRAIWFREEPVSILGAARNSLGQHEVDDTFAWLASVFSDCTSYRLELQSFGVVRDMAYTAGLEHVSVSFGGQARTFTLRATQVYRREDGGWKVAHRHADPATDDGAGPARALPGMGTGPSS